MRDRSAVQNVSRWCSLLRIAACLATSFSVLSFPFLAFAEDPYTNRHGVTVGAGFTAPRFANASLNPNGVGQLLYGTYYDVRPVLEPNGATDAQHVNIQILNTNRPGHLEWRDPGAGQIPRVEGRPRGAGLRHRLVVRRGLVGGGLS